jgi:hypothetical protein
MTPLEFLAALWKNKPEEFYVLIWTGQDKRSHWFQDVAAAGEFVSSESCRNTCVFVGLGLSRTDNGPNRRCTSKEIAGLCGVWSDLDIASAAHRGKALPPAVGDAISILPTYMPPTITVATGNGAQAWWLFKEPLIFETEEERRDAARIINRWHSMIRLDCATRGWAYDRLADFARVARVPGTRNMKDPANPKDVRVIACDESRRYSLSDFEEFLDDAAIPDIETQEKAAREWRERFKDAPITINLEARIPPEVIDSWLALDVRFRNTWERRRHDLKDPSQSGYDMALADFGVEAGLPEQQIVDLIVHHRAIHGQKKRTKLDYFQRTIARAFERNPAAPASQPTVPSTPAPAATSVPGATSVPAASSAPVSDNPSADAGGPPRDDPPPAKEMSPERVKADLCAKISAAIGIPVPITRLVQITGKDPSYRMELADGTKIEFATTKQFADEDAVRWAVAAQTKYIMPPIKAVRWREIAQDMLHACFDEQGPIETQWADAARDTVARYLDDNGFIEDIATAHPQYRGKPVMILGRIAINTTDFHAWINKTTLQALSVKALASMLSAMGAVQMTVPVKRREQSRWLLPIEHFDPADYEKAVPKTTDTADSTEGASAIQ